MQFRFNLINKSSTNYIYMFALRINLVGLFCFYIYKYKCYRERILLALNLLLHI